MRLKHNRVVVTGAAGSIGASICARFRQEGAIVTGIDVNKPVSCQFNIACDLGDGAALDAAGLQVLAEMGQPDVVVHCAALCHLATTQETDLQAFTKVMHVNVYAAMQLVKLFAPGMCEQQSGSIVILSSITGLVGAPGMAAYAASKGALHTATRTLALELAPHNITVNSISPASVDTPMLRDKLAQQPDPTLALQQNIERHPLGRLGKPQDIANLALFLASDEATWITGCDYIIDGGAHINRR
jgi:NAD(P)-dependent dehydrogenase (short-subunit alcohol dehydrogenase family)